MIVPLVTTRPSSFTPTVTFPAPSSSRPLRSEMGKDPFHRAREHIRPLQYQPHAVIHLGEQELKHARENGFPKVQKSHSLSWSRRQQESPRNPFL